MTGHWLACGMRDVPIADDWLSPAEAARLAGLGHPKRRSELRLSRWTAKHAIAAALGLDDAAGTLARIEVRPASTGAPVACHDGVPAPVAVSLTDRADWAVCLTGPPGAALGCDLELVEPRSAAFVRTWFTARERETVSAGDRSVLANLIWSAKESALKVLGTGLRRDTRSVEVELDAGGPGWSPLVVRAAEGTEFPGWWRRYGDFLLTCAATVPHAPPRCLTEPPSLAAAVPSHGWLTGVRRTGPSPVPGPRPGTAADRSPG
ncbi:4'-phosphopantetheinyl transferase superfamily protein [Amycolatopsis sp. NPDC021455]|uniref:4'-phosphopantetheinyl transferase family protein n=1 Tax=Amycolatopsis sp. NPDC021455 TaxID=3154901 RepID=UPI0033E1C8FD